MTFPTSSTDYTAVVADLIRQAVDDRWPDEVLALAGAVQDFPRAEALRGNEGTDTPRAL